MIIRFLILFLHILMTCLNLFNDNGFNFFQICSTIFICLCIRTLSCKFKLFSYSSFLCYCNIPYFSLFYYLRVICHILYVVLYILTCMSSPCLSPVSFVSNTPPTFLSYSSSPLILPHHRIIRIQE